MGINKEDNLSAYFPGLIDVCEGEEGQCLYLVVKEGNLSLLDSVTIEASEFNPPDREHFPFKLPRVSRVMMFIEQEDASLYSDVLAYLRRFSALDESQWCVVAHYIFLTYLHDHKTVAYCPVLLFFAVPERGKSRTGKSVAYLAFRGVHLIELREANIFRYSQNLRGTLFFDLMDVWKKAERNGCEDILLGRFEKGQKSSRVLYPEKGPFRDTFYFDIYGPTIVATNEQLHKILDTRCLPIIMPNIPGDYENPMPELALELKERLTAWRAKSFSASLPEINPIVGISGRLWDITKPLFQVGLMVNPAGHDLLKEAIFSIAGERSESKKDTSEGKIVGIIKDLSAEEGLEGMPLWNLKTSDILRKFNEDRPADKHVTPQWIGRKLKSLSLHHRTVNGRSEIILTQSEYRILIEQYGFICRDSAIHKVNPTETLPKQTLYYQGITGVVGSGRVSREPGDEEIPF